MSALLTLKEVAELENRDYYTVTKQVQRNRIAAIKIPADSRQGFEYRVSINELTEKARMRYYARLANEQMPVLEAEAETPAKYAQEVDRLTGEQQDAIAFWKKALNDWRKYIAAFPGQTTAKTKEFIQVFNTMNPDRSISERTLRNKWKLFREHGEVALADHRKNRRDRGVTNIHPVLESVFLQWWLDENQPTTSYMHKLLCAWAEMEMPELLPVPSVDSFYRLVNQIPEGVIKFFRYGEKVFTDECLLYLQRIYDGLDSNDIWSSDYHTLDIFVRDDLTNKVFRPHIVVWIDTRSRKILSMTLCESSNSDGVIISFKKAVKEFGIPKEVYLDNGREFLVRDFGGSGKRKSDEKAKYGTTMLARLDVEMTNARVRNGRAKVIERSFKKFSEEFSRLYMTYTGGRPDKRPERHGEVMKDLDNIPLRSEVERDLWTYIEGWYNEQASHGEGLNGMTPNACYDQNLIKKRTATAEQLDMIMLRTSRLQTVNRNGVYLKFGERKVWFYDTDLVHNFLGHKVFVCYDSEDLSRVVIRDGEERRIGYAAMLEVGGYNKEMDKEAIKKVKSLEKDQRNLVKDYFKDHAGSVDAPDALAVMLAKAEKNRANSTHEYDAKVIEIFRPEDKVHQTAVGGDDESIDLELMAKNAERKRRGKR